MNLEKWILLKDACTWKWFGRKEEEHKMDKMTSWSLFLNKGGILVKAQINGVGFYWESTTSAVWKSVEEGQLNQQVWVCCELHLSFFPLLTTM